MDPLELDAFDGTSQPTALLPFLTISLTPTPGQLEGGMWLCVYGE
jgi:hypothetical protein